MAVQQLTLLGHVTRHRTLRFIHQNISVYILFQLFCTNIVNAENTQKLSKRFGYVQKQSSVWQQCYL